MSPSSWEEKRKRLVTPPEKPPAAPIERREAAPRLGLLHLHDVGLAVGDAVVDVVDVGRQDVHLLVVGNGRLLRLGPLPGQTVPLPDDLLFTLGQLLSLLGTQKQKTRRPQNIFFV